MIGLLFYAGAYFHIEYGGESQDIFVAIFSMIFGAMSCGQAQQFGPDLGKARQAAERIFGILDEPNMLDAGQIQYSDLRLEERRAIPIIEFKNVWFRYPTRSEWVL